VRPPEQPCSSAESLITLGYARPENHMIGQTYVEACADGRLLFCSTSRPTAIATAWRDVFFVNHTDRTGYRKTMVERGSKLLTKAVAACALIEARPLQSRLEGPDRHGNRISATPARAFVQWTKSR